MPKTKKQPVDELKKQVEELTEALQRERADAINVRRRADEDRSKMADFYKAMIVQELLPAIDNLERALQQTPKEMRDHEYIKGVKSIFGQFEKVFSDLGVKRIKTIGEEFDPRYHEAISMEDAGGDVEVVCEELQPGYKIGDEVIRHAKVKVKMTKKGG